jgi:hypothetical protein
MGSVEGAGVYEEGMTVTLTATANEGYEFVHWIVSGDTLTVNPLELVVLSDVTVEAVFAAIPLPEYTVNVTVNDATMGSVEGAGVYEEGMTVTLTATANEGYEFVHWIVSGDTLTANPLELVVLSDVIVEAVFAAIPLPQYTVSVIVNDSTMGSVEGAGVYEDGTTATLVAVPNDGYVFGGWTLGEDELMENPLYIVVEGDIVIVATFKSSVTTGAENVEHSTLVVKKLLKDGHWYISIDGQLYTTTGARVE